MLVKTSEALAKSQEYYFSSKLRALEQLRRQGKDIINLGIGNPEEEPHDEVINAFVSEMMKKGVHGYQSYKGSAEMLKAISSWYEKYFGVSLPYDKSFLPLFGSKEGLSFILKAFVNHGEQVLVPNPGYPAYTAAAQLEYAVVKQYDLSSANDYLPSFDQLNTLVNEKTKLIFVNYPNMPTGMNASFEFFAKLIQWARKHHILVVLDNPYAMLFQERYSIFSVAGAADVAIELHSMSKSHHLAGWRIGFAAAAPDIIKVLLSVRSNYNTGHFRPFQSAVVTALLLDEEWYKNLRYKYMQKRKFVVAKLLDWGFDTNDKAEGMFVWAKIPQRFTSGDKVSDLVLNKAGVFLTPGKVFGSNGENYVRISLTSDFELIKRAFARIENIFNNKKIKL